jgi:phosphoglycolate phosphatase
MNDEMIKACIFDLDGTILNTITTITHFVNKTLQKHDISPITEAECKAFIGDGARKLIERSLASRGVFDSAILDEILTEYNTAYDADPYYLTERYDGMVELLSELRARGIKLGVISNKPHPTTLSAVNYFYPETFDKVMGGQSGVPLKPHPVSAKMMLDALDVSANEVAYIGDSGVDMLFGAAFGAKFTLGALWGFRGEDELLAAGADRIFTDVNELRGFLLERM